MIRLLQLASFVFCVIFSNAQNGSDILLKNYRPVSIYKVPVTKVNKAAFPVIDLHSHDDDATPEQIDQWVKTMDSVGIEKSVVLTYTSGKSFDSIVDKYKKYPDRFDIWCGFDYTDFGTPGWAEKAVKALVQCHAHGATGVGELGDKGLGELYSQPTPGKGVHINNPALKPLLAKCAELKMPISIHVAEDQWMYEKIDSTNDGLMNAAEWHVEKTPGKLMHDELLKVLDEAASQNPKTTFIACHLANSCSNLEVLGKMLDKNPNLYADFAARYGEISPIPRFAAAFFTKYQDRLVYGTDMGKQSSMYHITFRILETADEHFYEHDRFSYHWALYGLNLPKNVLKKIYHDNAARIITGK